MTAAVPYKINEAPCIADRSTYEEYCTGTDNDEQAVLSAVDIALKSGVPTRTHVLNLLHRLFDGKSFMPPTIDAPRH